MDNFELNFEAGRLTGPGMVSVNFTKNIFFFDKIM